jgi:hypothetical protein
MTLCSFVDRYRRFRQILCRLCLNTDATDSSVGFVFTRLHGVIPEDLLSSGSNFASQYNTKRRDVSAMSPTSLLSGESSQQEEILFFDALYYASVLCSFFMMHYLEWKMQYSQERFLTQVIKLRLGFIWRGSFTVIVIQNPAFSSIVFHI